MFFSKLYVVSLLMFPSRFVLAGPLKSAGSPSVLVGLLALLLCIVGRLLPQSTLHTGRQPIRLLILGYAFLCLLSYGVAQTRGLTDAESAGADRYLVLFLSIAGGSLLVVDGLRSREDVDSFVRWLLVGAYVSAVVGVLQFVADYDVAAHIHLPGFVINGDLFELARSDLRRANGTSLHAIEFGVVCATLAPLAVHYARFGTTQKIRRWHAAGATLLLFAGSMSVSRSFVLCAAVAMLIYVAVWNGRSRVNALALALVGAGVLRVTNGGLATTIKGLFLNSTSDSSVGARTLDYRSIGRLAQHRPLFGLGVGTFRPEQYFTLDNQWLGTLVEGGVVLFLAMGCLYVLGASTARAARRTASDPRTKDLGQAVAAGLVALAVGGAFFDEFTFRQAFTLLFLMLAIAGALWRHVAEAAGEELRHI